MLKLTGTERYSLRPDELAMLYAKRSAIKASMPTWQEDKVLEWIIEKRPLVLSKEAAEFLNVCEPQATGVLLRLFKKGYLQRGTIPSPTTRSRYAYSLAEGLREPLEALGYDIARSSLWNATGQLISY